MYRCSAFVWRTILRKHSACSLGTRLDPWLCLNIVPDTHSEPQTCQYGHVSPHHSPYIDKLRSLPWAFVSNGRAVCSISTKQAFYTLKPPGKSYVPQVSVRHVRMACFRFYNFPKIVFVYPVSTYQPRQHCTCTISAYMTNMNVYTEASATQQNLFDETRSYRRVSTDYYMPSIIAPP